MVSELLVASKDAIEELGGAVPEPVARLARGPRVLGDLRGRVDGPTLIAVGGLHGNEPAGALALQRLVRRLEAAPPDGLCGRLVALVGNRQALAQGCRFLRYDLNRFWTSERVERLRRSTDPLEAEAEELRDLDSAIEKILAARAGRPVYFLDLHTTSGAGAAFANLDDTLPNRAFALEFPVTLVVGIEEELGGTLASHLCDRGVITVGFESGQHREEAAVDRAEAAGWIALEAAGLLARGSRPEVAAARQLLAAHRGSRPHVVEVLHRHAISPGDEFRMLPGFHNFQPVRAGQVLACDHHGEIVAQHNGLLVMPLYQDQGEDGFFLVRQIHPMWLRLSRSVRRLSLDRYLHLLPGVHPNPALEDSYTIDRRYARWFALEIFHLLGYRRHGEAGRFVVMARRSHDRS